MREQTSFTSIDLGTPKPTAVPQETIEVDITTEQFLGDFAKAFVAEAARVNPLRSEQVKLTREEVTNYCDFLLDQRVKCIDNECELWRKLKSLYIPSFIQYALSLIGECRLRDRGLLIRPIKTKQSTMTFEEALSVSEKIGSFIDDLQIVQDAMPRSTEGDKDVMTSALIAGYVVSMQPVDHVISTYMVAFLGLKLKEEMAFKVLYRVQYDDLDFIASALLTEKKLF
jgi:hypothetical protein